MDKKSFVTFIKDKKTRMPLFLLALGLILIILPLVFSNGEGEKSQETLEGYKAALEAELSELCSDVYGVGKCKVSVSFERGETKTYKGSNVVETKPPKVLGITIVCKGADSDRVRAQLTEMMCALFELGSNRVAILKLNS